MMHDDGQQADDLEDADVLLIGVSRTSKTNWISSRRPA
jgi:regulator of PEP synthase PpsR (kinase-PPPase family)